MILVGDIGGTNARFGCYVDGERRAVAHFSTTAFESVEDLLAAARDSFAEEDVTACCLAVAGPVLGDEARLTNGRLAFSRQAVAACLQVHNRHLPIELERVHLVNDLLGLGSAIAARRAAGELIGGTPNDGTEGVVAAGTGLGMAILVDGKCLPSEGGHARVAPVGGFERELLAATEAEQQQNGSNVAWEHYLSGPGLETLYRAVCHVWGAPAEAINAQEISRRALAGSDPPCHTTLETWAGMLATACGSLAVTALTLGGIHLAGPLPVTAAEWLRGASFRRRFSEAAWAADYLQHIPIYLITDPCTGLDGAHEIAMSR